MEKGYLNEVKAILKSLVLSCTDKMTVDKLNRDYRDVEGENIPYRRLGFGNIELFLKSIPDTLRVYGSGPTAMVCFVANDRSDHIHDMIMEQRKPKSRSRRSNLQSKNKISTQARCSNKFSNKSQSRKMPGKQFSVFQSTNRTHMTKTLTVRNDALPLPGTITYPNHSPCYSPQIENILGFQLSQPAGINSINLENSQTILPKLQRKAILYNKKDNIKGHEIQIKQLTSLLTNACHITSPSTKALQMQTETPLVSICQTQLSPSSLKMVSFSPETKSSYYQNNINEKKPPTVDQPTKKIKIKKKFSEDSERLLSMPPRTNLNPIQEVGKTCEKNENCNNKSDKDLNVSKKFCDKLNELFDFSDGGVDDLDEAIPQFAANNLVYRLDFPEHTVPFGRKIVPYVLSDDVYKDSVRIFIAEIHSPFKFWFHIQRDNHELDKLMYQMECFYKSLDGDELQIPIACLTPGQTCSALYNDSWHRAEIVGSPVKNKIKVSFVDYGTVSDVNITNVKYLISCFGELPTQALRGCLSHIKPRFLHWSHEATNCFLSLVSELMLYAKITEIDRENQIMYMIICNTHGDEVVQINKTLIEKRYALFNEHWLEMQIKKNNGQRLHHPREDFPTFAMIELGEYPSFAELVELQKRGIDYEAIHDHIIFNKSAILNKHENVPEAIRNLPYFLMTTNPFRSDIIMELNGFQTAKEQ